MARTLNGPTGAFGGGGVLYPGFTGINLGSFLLQRLQTGAQRTQRGLLRPTNGVYARIPRDGLFTQGNLNQQIDLSSTVLRKIGGTSVAANTAGFAYTSTTTTITWFWDGTNGSAVIVITRADGSKFRVPIAGSNLTITGLIANTTYYFLPFWNISNQCNIGWVQGTTGNPQIAFVVGDTTDANLTPQYLLQQTMQGVEPLSNGFMTAATTAGGGGGGGAGGGGTPGNGCVMSGTQIEPLGEGGYTVEVLSETQWVYIKTVGGNELNCTFDHPLYDANRGKVRADTVTRGDTMIMDDGEQEVEHSQFFSRKCSKHKVHMPHGHLFWANGFLSHNWKK